jgi:hypothetical protein
MPLWQQWDCHGPQVPGEYCITNVDIEFRKSVVTNRSALGPLLLAMPVKPLPVVIGKPAINFFSLYELVQAQKAKKVAKNSYKSKS